MTVYVYLAENEPWPLLFDFTWPLGPGRKFGEWAWVGRVSK